MVVSWCEPPTRDGVVAVRGAHIGRLTRPLTLAVRPVGQKGPRDGAVYGPPMIKVALEIDAPRSRARTHAAARLQNCGAQWRRAAAGLCEARRLQRVCTRAGDLVRIDGRMQHVVW